jgi:UDP-N-acetylglucosamine 2-epimerase (non-hydrolysing)
LHITCIVGARPNFMKVAPILDAAHGRDHLETRLVHTGQHYDAKMSDTFFEELGLPEPDIYLGVGSGSHAAQTARVMIAFDEVLDQHPTDLVLVVGDVNSTLACALVAAKRGIAVAHVEAGLRSRDRTMPEELNRILTDQLSDWLFTSERSATPNLLAEGVPESKIVFVGNVMIDSLLKHREAARRRETLARLDVRPREYALATLHRPSNVDTIESARNAVRALEAILDRLALVLPVHPRTRARLQEFGLLSSLETRPNLRLVEPLGYLDFLCLNDQARFVFTDSGGIQEETTALGVPCLTFRENTERPITVTEGTNTLLGTDAARVGPAVDRILSEARPTGRIPEFWDGKAAQRIVDALASKQVGK